MNPRAAICDVYQTLLDVAPAPADAGERWKALCRETFANPVSTGLEEFHERCKLLIAREHAVAKAVGIAFPEIYWPAIAVEAMTALRELSPVAVDDFLFRHAGLCHTVRLMNGAADALRELARRGILLGLASNGQPYSVRELQLVLERAGLSLAIFDPTLRFWSFEHGFSKPNPHVIRMLTARLRHLCLPPGEALMIGDRLDNDIEPARLQGWQTWHFAGDWSALVHSLPEPEGSL